MNRSETTEESVEPTAYSTSSVPTNIVMSNDLGLKKHDEVGSAYIFSVFTVLVGMLIFAYFALSLLKKYKLLNFVGSRDPQNIGVVTQRISSKTTVHTLRIENSRYLLIESSENISLNKIVESNIDDTPEEKEHS